MAKSIVVTLLVGGLLSLLMRFFFPQIIDDSSSTEKITIGIKLWSVAVACGVLEGFLCWRKRKKQ
jgi:hypothetical protein